MKEHAQSIAEKLCDNKWWDELNALLDKPIEPQKTERELLIKRLNYWINHYEGDITSEAPMYVNDVRTRSYENSRCRNFTEIK